MHVVSELVVLLVSQSVSCMHIMYLKFVFSSVRFEVFIAVMVHVVVFRVMTLCCDVVVVCDL